MIGEHLQFEVRRDSTISPVVSWRGSKCEPSRADWIKCRAPLEIAWQGGDGYLEIRAGLSDDLVTGDLVANSVQVTVRGTKASPKNGSKVFTLPRPGEYRVRLFPTERTFLDPPFEWWLKIDARNNKVAQPKKSGMSSARLPRIG